MSRTEDWPTWVYLLKESTEDSRYLKVGFADDLTKRVSGLQCGNPRVLELGFALRVRRRRDAKLLEAQFLEQAARSRIYGEWIEMPLEDATKLLITIASAANITVLGYAPAINGSVYGQTLSPPD